MLPRDGRDATASTPFQPGENQKGKLDNEMKPPTTLKGEARRFFVRHADRCEQDGTLTDATLDSFILLCRTWAILNDIDTENDPKGLLSWNGTLKSFERFATQFRLFSKRPVEKQEDITSVLNKLMGGPDATPAPQG